jgi:hypothetical protein
MDSANLFFDLAHAMKVLFNKPLACLLTDKMRYDEENMAKYMNKKGLPR